tara:strand:- start:163 stop:1485 length:1323 start_codon:yes stop_codon:yes gene_type:complete
MVIKNFKNSNLYRKKIHNYIVAGSHTYSKGDDQFPLLSPAAISYGKGSSIWDIDGNKYIDCTLGLGSISIGHASSTIVKAVIKEAKKGVNFQRPSKIELDVAKEFLSILPNMDLIKFAKNGSSVTTAAVKLSRSYTGKDIVAFPKDHPFYSFDDWFICAKEINSGIPRDIKKFSVTYDSRDPDSLNNIFKKYKNKIACVITEAENLVPISKDYILEIEKITKKNKAVFIIDEMLSGFRSDFPGSYTKFKLNPDLTTWGKAIGNGFSFCALAGKKKIMELGGIKQISKPRVFLLSSTHGAETIGLAAGKAVIKIYKEKNVIGHNKKIIKKLYSSITETINKFYLYDYIKVHYSDWRIYIEFLDNKKEISNIFKTLFMQEMIKNGVLFQSLFLPCYSHTFSDIKKISLAFKRSCQVYKFALERGINQFLHGKPIKNVFRKYV